MVTLDKVNTESGEVGEATGIVLRRGSHLYHAFKLRSFAREVQKRREVVAEFTTNPNAKTHTITKVMDLHEYRKAMDKVQAIAEKIDEYAEGDKHDSARYGKASRKLREAASIPRGTIYHHMAIMEEARTQLLEFADEEIESARRMGAIDRAREVIAS